MGTPDEHDSTIAAGRRSPVRPSLAAVAAIVPMLAWYAYTDQRDVQFWDVGEMQTVPWIYGIAHPTGFPLYTMLGWLFAHVVAVGPVAWRLSLFSSVAMCAAGWFAYRIVEQGTGSAWLGIASAWTFDAASVAWSRGTRADVHPLCAAFEAATLCALCHWRRTGDGRYYIAAFALLGAALAVHPVALFVFPAALALAIPASRTVARTRVLAASAFFVPLLTYATIPLRSAMLFATRRDPTLAIGMPPGRPFWDYAHTEVWTNFLWFVTGAQFHRDAGASGYSDPRVFARSMRLGWTLVHHEFGIPLLLLAAFGLWALARRDLTTAVALTLLASSVVPFAFAYAEEADKERYMLMPLFAIACLVGYGAGGIEAELARRFRSARLGADALFAAALIAVSAWHFDTHRSVIDANRDTLARRYVSQVETLVPSGAIVIADWTYATPLAYAAYVERSLGDRIVVAGTVENMSGYIASWQRTACVAYVSNDAMPSAASRRFGAAPLNRTLPYLFLLGKCTPAKQARESI